MAKRGRKIMLDLEDFNNILSVKEQLKQDSTKEELEKKYIEEIQRLKQEYENKLKEETQKAYQQGYNDALQKADTVLRKEYEEKLQAILQEKDKEIENLLNNLKNLENSIKEKQKRYFESVREILVDSLAEILEFLYIDVDNYDRVIKAIENILLEFKEETKVEIQVSENLYPLLKDRFSFVKSNPELEHDDFIIDFGDFQIENRVKEKLKIIKDEIKREIKKLT